jgi:5-methylcytosine-specific restriction protein A
MGTKGNQSLTFGQNRTLSESDNNGVSVHLFEVFVEKEYMYMGEVELSAEPYFEEQPDENDLIREVCVFPLRLKNGKPVIIDKDYSEKAFLAKAKKARRLSDQEVENRAQNAKKRTGQRSITSKQHDRDPWVAEHAKRAANGVCQLCENDAPFKNKAGEPFLETHHIIWLAKGGEDTINNTVALCPNCHKKMHILNSKKDIQILLRNK